jgi:hypothetical protein
MSVCALCVVVLGVLAQRWGGVCVALVGVCAQGETGAVMKRCVGRGRGVCQNVLAPPHTKHSMHDARVSSRSPYQGSGTGVASATIQRVIWHHQGL